MLVTVPLAGAGVDMFLPSLPAMTRAMQTTDFAVQQTVLIYLGFYALAQIVFGPLVDRWGRRIPSAVGAAVMAGASVVIANSDSIALVLVMRVIQGVGGAVTVVAARSIVSDCYDGHKRARAANWMTIAWACGPILSPALGGYLQHWFDWHATFWVLGGWAGATVVTSLVFLPETRRVQSTGPLRAVFLPYRQIAADPIYMASALAMGCLITIMYGFEVLAPFYIQVDLKRDAVFYGHLQLSMGCFWMAGNLTNRLLSRFWTDFKRAAIAATIAMGLSAGMIAVDLAGGFGVLALAVPAGVVFFLAASVWPILYAICLGRFPHAGGAANALVSGLFSLISGAFAFGGTFLQSATAWPMWAIFVLGLGFSLLVIVGCLRRTLTLGVGQLESIDLRR
jgi:multidrug resistance protein